MNTRVYTQTCQTDRFRYSWKYSRTDLERSRAIEIHLLQAETTPKFTFYRDAWGEGAALPRVYDLQKRSRHQECRVFQNAEGSEPAEVRLQVKCALSDDRCSAMLAKLEGMHRGVLLLFQLLFFWSGLGSQFRCFVFGCWIQLDNRLVSHNFFSLN